MFGNFFVYMLKLDIASNIFYSLFLQQQEPFSPKGGAIVMATTKYEITYIIKPDVDEDSKKALIDKYDKVVTDNGGSMVESKDWGKRRFAYEMDKYREGVYHIMTFTAEDAKAVDEFSRLSKIDSAVLRSMTVKLDK
jgi:small subunit ribosomal protein S6